jgi:hypothetical protein
MFATKVSISPVFIDEVALRRSRRLMRKKVRSFRDDIRANPSDVEFINSRQEKIKVLNIIIKEMSELIDNYSL